MQLKRKLSIGLFMISQQFFKLLRHFRSFVKIAAVSGIKYFIDQDSRRKGKL